MAQLAQKEKIEMDAKIVRELMVEDLDVPAASSESKAPSVARITDRHRRAARLFALGYSATQVAAQTGYQLPRLSVLKKDPAFVELISFFRGQVDAQFVTVAERLADMTGDSIAEIQSRLENSPEEFTVNELRDLIALGADRTGHGPARTGESSRTSINISIAERLESAQARVIEGTAKEVPNDHDED
jgi:hypothetical protein